MGWDDGAREGWGWGWGWGWAGRGSFGSGERVWRAGRGRKRRESQRRGGTDGRMDGVGRWLRAASVEEEEEEVVEEARLWCWCWCWLPGADSAVVVRCCKEDAGNVGDWAVWMHAGGGGGVGGWIGLVQPGRDRGRAAMAAATPEIGGGGGGGGGREAVWRIRAAGEQVGTRGHGGGDGGGGGDDARLPAAAAARRPTPPAPDTEGRRLSPSHRVPPPSLPGMEANTRPFLPRSPPIGRVVLVLAGSV